jgi:tripartite-type tricarboxylate transporter receptor subunit TctC
MNTHTRSFALLALLLSGCVGPVSEDKTDVARVLDSPDLVEWLTNHGGRPMKMTQPEFARFVRSETESAARIIEAAGLRRR